MELINISSIVEHLETKLNRAIVQDIQEKGEQSYFENERETFRFRLCLDTGTYKGFDYLKRGATPNADGGFTQAQISPNLTRKYVRYINGLFTVNESTIEGVESPNLTFSVSVEFCIPIDQDKDDTYRTEEMIGSVRALIDNAMALNEYSDFDGYNMGVGYGLGLTGSRQQRGQVGDSITLMAYFTYAFVANGINSTEITITIDDNITVSVPRQGFSRVASQESDVDLEDASGTAKVSTLSSVFTINFDRPSKKDALGDMINTWLLTGENIAHKVDISMPTRTGNTTVTKIMVFAETTANTERTLNASNTVMLAEAMINNEVVLLSTEAQRYLSNAR